MTSETPYLELGVTHAYGSLTVLDGIRLSIRRNEFVCVCGPSGCGKTTLSELVAGLQSPQPGSEVLLEGRPVDPKRHNISFVFQEPSALPWQTVRENIGIGLRIKKQPRDEIERRVDEIIDVVGLRGFEDFHPHQISGGMKQRVAIARAFAMNADLILMDEPFVSLDQPTRERMQREVLDIWERHKRTIIFVTHNLEEALFLADRVVVLSSKPARIREDLKIPMPRPREILSPQFVELRARLAALLEDPGPTAAAAADEPTKERALP
jgi:ABC-type nitrate/sulfonate/bicarbonate transport system ATPase subunit